MRFYIHFFIHKFYVFFFILKFCLKLLYRGVTHDFSKLSKSEREYFKANFKTFRNLEYWGDDYISHLFGFSKKALKIHYWKNRHHPEHFDNKLEGMKLVDLVEMVFDWKAAIKQNKQGNLNKTLERSKKRFKIPETLIQIIKNELS